MKTRRLRALGWMSLLVGAAVASSCNAKPSPHIIMRDPGVDPSAQLCDPVEQTGCDPGQKCTWVRDQASYSAYSGELACVPDGTVELDGNCTYGLSGGGSGYDNCKKGLIC